MTFVIVSGGIDLSVGSVIALASVVVALVLDGGGDPTVAVGCGVATGVACGLINGLLITSLRVVPFIVTLGMLEMARGATKVVTDSQSIYIGKRIEGFGEPLHVISLSPAFLLACVVVVAGQFLLTRTVFGRYCIAIGTNAEAVRMSGIRAAPYSIAVFVLSGVMCGLAGLAPVHSRDSMQRKWSNSS